MGTIPVQQQIQSEIQSEVSALAHRHVTLSYSILGVLVLALVLAGLGGWLSIKGYERALQRAEAAEAVSKQHEADFNEKYKALSDLLAQHEADRAKEQEQQNKLLSQIATRASQPVPTVIQTGLRPDATAQDARNAIAAVTSAAGKPVSPEVTPDQKVAVNVPESQQLISLLYEGNAAKLDLRDTKMLFTLEQTKNSSLSNDLTQCRASVKAGKVTIAADDKTIADYKKAATRSRFRKFLDGAEKVALLLGGVAIGHKF